MGRHKREDTKVKIKERAINELKDLFAFNPRNLFVDPETKEYTPYCYEKVSMVLATHGIETTKKWAIDNFLNKNFILR